MVRETDEVAEAMIKRRTVAFFRNQIARCLIDIAESHAGANQCDRSLVRRAGGLIDLAAVIAHALIIKSAGHVRAVAVLHAAHVKENAISLLQHGVVRLMMRIRRIGTEGDQRRKGKALRPEFLINAEELISDFPLRDPRMDQRTQTRHRRIVDGGGAAHFFLLLLVLHRAGLIDRKRAVHKARRKFTLHERKQEACRNLLVHTEDFILHEIRCKHLRNRIGVGEPYFFDAAVHRRIKELV